MHLALWLKAHRENKRKLGKNDSRREKEAAASSVVAASFVLLRDETDERERGLTDGRTDGRTEMGVVSLS